MKNVTCGNFKKAIEIYHLNLSSADYKDYLRATTIHRDFLKEMKIYDDEFTLNKLLIDEYYLIEHGHMRFQDRDLSKVNEIIVIDH